MNNQSDNMDQCTDWAFHQMLEVEGEDNYFNSLIKENSPDVFDKLCAGITRWLNEVMRKSPDNTGGKIIRGPKRTIIITVVLNEEYDKRVK